MQFWPASKLSSQQLRTLVTCTALVIAAIVGANAFVLALLHQSTLRDVQNDLLRQSVDLSELVERTLQSVDLVLGSVAEKASALAPTEDDKLALTGEDFHIFLKEKLSGLPQIHALGISDADGQRLNFSQYWPVPGHDLSFRTYFKALKADRRLTSYLEAPVKGSVTDRWTIINARPIFASNGMFAVFASTETKYFRICSAPRWALDMPLPWCAPTGRSSRAIRWQATLELKSGARFLTGSPMHDRPTTIR